MKAENFSGNLEPLDVSLGYPWLRSDAGRALSKRPRQRNDCTVRAIASAFCISYDEAYELLKEAGRESGKRYRLADYLNHKPGCDYLTFPAKKGVARMNPALFVITFPSGRYVCKAARHVFAVINGVVYDDSPNCADRCIYSAWRINL